MQFNSHATNLDCVSEIHKICGSTSSNNDIKDITRRFNAALDWYVHLAGKAGKKWPFDDANQSSSPKVTQTLTSNTNEYKWSAFSGSLLYATKLQVLDSTGSPVTLEFEDFASADFENDYKTSNTGTPARYTNHGDFFYVTPTPSYTTNSGIIAYGVRQALYMASTDTTKIPGVPVIHHTALCRKASLPYLIENRLPNAGAISQLVAQDERDILEYHGYRNFTAGSRMVPHREDNR